MKNLFLKLSIFVFALFCTCSFVGCVRLRSGNAFNLDLEENSYIYDYGTSVVYVVFDEDDEDSSEFINGIGVKDVTLGGDVKGKTVEAVEYISSKKIKVTIGGESANYDELGELTVSHTKIKNNLDSTLLFYLRKAGLTARTKTISSSGGTTDVSTTIIPKNCTINDTIDTSSITIKLNNENLSISNVQFNKQSDGNLILSFETATTITYQSIEITFAENVTNLGKVFTVIV